MAKEHLGHWGLELKRAGLLFLLFAVTLYGLSRPMVQSLPVIGPIARWFSRAFAGE